jgi:hypothetical protein
MGMVGFYGRFIPIFSDVAAVLDVLKKKGDPIDWREEHQEAFDALKQALCAAPVLQVPDFDTEFVFVTDASDLEVSAFLHKRVNGSLAPISYYSMLLSGAERRYSTYEKECLAVIFVCEKCRTYLDHQEFDLKYDNLALC